MGIADPHAESAADQSRSFKSVKAKVWFCRRPPFRFRHCASILLMNGAMSSDIAVALAAMPVAKREERERRAAEEHKRL